MRTGLKTINNQQKRFFSFAVVKQPFARAVSDSCSLSFYYILHLSGILLGPRSAQQNEILFYCLTRLTSLSPNTSIGDAPLLPVVPVFVGPISPPANNRHRRTLRASSLNMENRVPFFRTNGKLQTILLAFSFMLCPDSDTGDSREILSTLLVSSRFIPGVVPRKSGCAVEYDCKLNRFEMAFTLAKD